MTVTKDDFEKVWASTSPLTPYAFSDAKYKEGWNFVGSIPPSRQMWDYLQKNNDEKMQYLLNHFDNYLPLSGGTVTGEITVPTANAGNSSKVIANTAYVQGELTNYLPLSGGTMRGTITTTANPGLKVSDNDHYLVLCGASSYTHGAHILLHGKNSVNKGTFGIVANDGSDGYVMLMGKPDGTLTWGGQPLLPVGVVQAFAGSTIPTGWLLCDGSAVSRTLYATLFAVIGTTYGAGDGSTTFNLPNLTDKFIQGSATAGTVKSAGLPNITGSFKVADNVARNGLYAGVVDSAGAFAARNSDHSVASVKDGNYSVIRGSLPDIVQLDASKSNSIYGNSTTVQPPALTMRYIIKY